MSDEENEGHVSSRSPQVAGILIPLIMNVDLSPSGPALFQSEEGLTRTAPASLPQMREYRAEQYKRTGGSHYDLSQLPQGAAGTQEALKKMLGRDPTPTEVANARAYLDTLAFSEGTSTIGYKKNGGQGYDVQVGGRVISDLSHHPGQVIDLGNGLRSSAFGRYQFLKGTWNNCASALHLTDMSPAAQDAAALFLIHEAPGGAFDAMLKGDFARAVQKTGGIWASLPGSNLGQGQQRYDKLLAVYQHSGGMSEGQTVAGNGQQNTQPSSESPGYMGQMGRLFSGIMQGHSNIAAMKNMTVGVFDHAYGDSIAVLATHAGVPGSSGPNPSYTWADCAVSRTPEQILTYLKTLPAGSLKGQNILLSTGASNNPDQVALAADQIKLLKEKLGASAVTLLGVGPREDYVRKGINDKLGKIASENGATFAGPLQGTGADHVHPANHTAVVAMVDTALEALTGVQPHPQSAKKQELSKAAREPSSAAVLKTLTSADAGHPELQKPANKPHSAPNTQQLSAS